MQQTNDSTGFPEGGSIRLSGTLLHTSAEFQAVLRQTGEHQAVTRNSSAHRGRHKGVWLAPRGLWE